MAPTGDVLLISFSFLRHRNRSGQLVKLDFWKNKRLEFLGEEKKQILKVSKNKRKVIIALFRVLKIVLKRDYCLKKNKHEKDVC